MFGAQVTGAVLGCFIAPLCFWLFWTAFPIGVPGTTYFAPCEPRGVGLTDSVFPPGRFPSGLSLAVAGC